LKKNETDDNSRKTGRSEGRKSNRHKAPLMSATREKGQKEKKAINSKKQRRASLARRAAWQRSGEETDPHNEAIMEEVGVGDAKAASVGSRGPKGPNYLQGPPNFIGHEGTGGP